MSRRPATWGEHRAEQKALADYQAHLGKVHEAECLTDDDGRDYGPGWVKVMPTPRKLIVAWDRDRTELLPTWNVKPVRGTAATATQELRPTLSPSDFEDDA
jgi:hypothetical protein